MAIPVLNVLFSKDPKTKFSGDLEGLEVDAVITRGTDFSAQVTRAQVEDGTTISDHVVLDPVSLQIEGFISNHPVGLLEGLGSAVEAIGSFFGSEPEKTRSQTGAKTLEAAWRAKALLSIETRTRTYDNMVIESLSIAESAEIGEGISFSMRLVEIRKVSLVTVPGSKLATATADLASGPVDKGRQPPKPPKTSPAAITSLSQAAAVA